MGQEKNFNNAGIVTLKDNLEKQRVALLTALQTMHQTNQSLSESLTGETKQAYQTRAMKIEQNAQKSMEALGILIKQVEQSNQAAFEVDQKIGEQIK